MMFIVRNLSTLFLVVFIIVAISASFYKYLILADFETLFHAECDVTSDQCFSDTNSCEEGAEGPDCAKYFKAYLANQGAIDSECNADDGMCLIKFCKDSYSCTPIECGSDLASKYGLTNECTNI